MEGANHPCPRQILSGSAQHSVQPGLYFFIHGHGNHHDPKHHNGQNRYGHHKNKGRPGINEKRHDHGAKHDKGRTKKQPQHHIDAILHLIHIGSHPGDQGGRPQCINLRKRKALDMVKKGVLQLRGKSHRRFGRKILCRNGAKQPHQPQHYKEKPASQHKACI